MILYDIICLNQHLSSYSENIFIKIWVQLSSRLTMIRDNEIITNNDRLNSHLDYNQVKFKYQRQTSLKYNSSFPKESTNINIYESERTNYQTIFQKVGYSVSQDLYQQEQQRITKESPVSTEIQSFLKVTSLQSQQFSFIPRGQSIEIFNNNDQFINIPESPYSQIYSFVLDISIINYQLYNHQNIRKTFQNHEGSYEYLNENLQSGGNNNTIMIQSQRLIYCFLKQQQSIRFIYTPKPIKSISLSNKTISKDDNPILLIMKFKRIRRCFQVIRALFRLKTLYNLKKSTWNFQMDVLRRNQKILKYNESITQIKIKQWTQMVLTKMISIIQQKNLEQQQLNFIDYPETMTFVQIDQAVIFIQNNFTFAMSNLLVMTTGKNLLYELNLQMYQDQYFEYRKQFSKFVSERVNYLTYHYSEMNEQEKQLVLCECIIIHNLIPSLVKLTNSLEALKCNIKSVEFLIRCIISLFQYFFILKFSDYPKIQIKNNNIKYSQYHLGKNQSQLTLVQNQQLKSDDLIDGVYTEQQMQLILKKESWLQSNKKRMNLVSQNLAIVV